MKESENGRDIYRIESHYERLPEISSAEEARIFCQKGEIFKGKALLCRENHDLIVLGEKNFGIIPRRDALYMPDGSIGKDIAVITRVGKDVCFTVSGIAYDRELEEKSEFPVLKLSRFAAQKTCYDGYISHLRAGDVIPAKISHIEPFGVFCDIGCGFTALLPLDMISVSRIVSPRERFDGGEDVFCVVRSIDEENARITLSHKELLGTWEENAANFHAGETVQGIIRSVEDYGVFVELAPNLAGLAEWSPDAKAGHVAAVYIKSILPEKMKIKLVIVDVGDAVGECTNVTYYIKEGHIDCFDYSPPCCQKQVRTVFA